MSLYARSCMEGISDSCMYPPSFEPTAEVSTLMAPRPRLRWKALPPDVSQSAVTSMTITDRALLFMQRHAEMGFGASEVSKGQDTIISTQPSQPPMAVDKKVKVTKDPKTPKAKNMKVHKVSKAKSDSVSVLSLAGLLVNAMKSPSFFRGACPGQSRIEFFWSFPCVGERTFAVMTMRWFQDKIWSDFVQL